MKAVIVFIVAIILILALGPIGFLVAMLCFTINKKGFYDYFWNLAIGIDQFGNVVCGPLFNITLIKKGGYKFGNPDETISGVLGKNKLSGHLTKTGHALDYILEKLEKNHTIDAIEDDEGNK